MAEASDGIERPAPGKIAKRGDTLVEILLTIVVIGIVGSAAFYTSSIRCDELRNRTVTT